MNLTELVVKNLPATKKVNPSGGFYICCTMCTSRGESRNDTKFRGGFTLKPDNSFVYHCYNCNYATGWQKDGKVSKNLMAFLRTLGIEAKDIPISLRLLKTDEKLTKNQTAEIKDINKDFQEVKMPAGARPINDWINEKSPPALFVESLEYLISRGDPIYNGWEYYWTNDSYYSLNQRVLIPFKSKGKTVGWTGRKFTTNSKISRYYSKQPKEYMFNQDILSSTSLQHIFLVEGVFDAIAINGIALLGNVLTEQQIQVLKSSGKQIILIPDRNNPGKRLVEQAIEQNWQVSIPDWDRNITDCAAATERYGKLYTIYSIMNGRKSESTAIRVHFDLARI